MSKVKNYYHEEIEQGMMDDKSEPEWFESQDTDNEWQAHCEKLLEPANKEFMDSLDKIPF